ncbi:hypothetical protein SV7mr_11050 [Stieleria bergensis]|uniref:Uncharacterized protein n=1 Tax=Stieleria bergensis TaxID=2528025 RepID=A0A517SR49_9BACT|nr:hypothetical protein SV7mr_11050 [Planctomycetes bacterium SV_7m_r]
MFQLTTTTKRLSMRTKERRGVDNRFTLTSLRLDSSASGRVQSTYNQALQRNRAYRPTANRSSPSPNTADPLRLASQLLGGLVRKPAADWPH